MRLAPVALVLVLAAPVAATEPSAQAFLQSIYAQYLGPNGKGVKLDGDADLPRWFAPPVVALMRRDRERSARRHDVGALDGDPFVDAQDWALSDLHISVEEQAARALGRVQFKNIDTTVAITLDLVLIRGHWRVADIHWPEGSLMALLRAAR
jgi:hypothetical protein